MKTRFYIGGFKISDEWVEVTYLDSPISGSCRCYVGKNERGIDYVMRSEADLRVIDDELRDRIKEAVFIARLQ